MLIDSATIHVRSGKGGDGHTSFARYKYLPKGGPNGGDGGNGGSIRLIAKYGVETLLDFAGRHHWQAEDGVQGGIKQCAGRNGADLDIFVPAGTLIYDEADGKLIADLDKVGKELVVARGGRGGWGNEHFKSATRQAPREHTLGGPAEERTLRLELKLIADVGLVGMPNAGKSTLLSRISRARPKIADYPFTTLEPNLGIAELVGGKPRRASKSAPRRAGEDGEPAAHATPTPGARRIVVADIPGLIEGAHQGHGLGIQFLRHVERTRVLVHLLDVDPTGNKDGSGRDIVENFRVVNRELASYSKKLGKKPQIVVLTKLDLLPNPEDRKAAKKLVEEALGQPVLAISASSGEGLTELLEACWVVLDRERRKQDRAAAKKALASLSEEKVKPPVMQVARLKR